MARIEKTRLDFFPFDIDFFDDEKIVSIFSEFGSKGELVTVKLLCEVYRNGYFLEWKETVRIKLVQKMAGVSEDVGEAYDKISEKAAPVVDKIQEKASPVVDKASEKLLEVELIKQLKEGINSVGDLIDTFGSKDAAEKFGEDFAEKMKTHAEALKEKGEEFCDCDACRKARSILKDFGEDLEGVMEKAEGKFEELKAKADEAMGDAADTVEDAAEKVEEAAEDFIEE